MNTGPTKPAASTGPAAIIKALAERLYNQAIMDNRERGQYAEQLVLSALGGGWKYVGTAWHPWDIESTGDAPRVRIQVRQSAIRQLWVPLRFRKPSFPTEPKVKPSYTVRDHPDIQIETHGRFCEIYVFCWHGEAGDVCDQRRPEQWQFFVMPEKALGTRKKATVAELESEWLAENGGRAASWKTLREAVEEVAHEVRKARPPAAR